MLLAIFPLQLALFPGETIALHIFEPRYKQLIQECRDEGISFGIPSYVNGYLSTHGTEVELLRIMRTSDKGEMDILVRGKRVFHIESVESSVPNKLYSGAMVRYPENESGSTGDLGRQLIQRFEKLMRVRKTGIRIDEYPDENLSFHLAPIAGLSLGEKIEILSMAKERDRQTTLVENINSLIERHVKPDETEVRLGGNGHSKAISLNKG